MIKTFAFLVKNPFYEKYGVEMKEHGINGGLYNGYVGFNEILPLSYQGGASSDFKDNKGKVLDDYIHVHGGITFDSKFNEMRSIVPLTEIPQNWYCYRIIGFDCLHFADTEENCPIDYIKDQTLKLKEQIDKLINDKKLSNI